MSARPPSLRDRLRGGSTRPMLLGPSPVDVVDGVLGSGPSALVDALRRAADAVIALQRRILDAGAELVVAPTAETTAPALHQSGQAYRAAALTAAAVDLTRDAAFAARTQAAVIGEVVASGGARARAEARTHVERLATSAIDAVLVWGDDPEGLLDVARAAAAHGLPTLLQIAVASEGGPLGADPVATLDRTGVLGALAGIEAAAPAVLVVTTAELELACATLTRLRTRHPRLSLGVRLAIDDGHSNEPNEPAKQASAQLAAAAAWGALAPFGLSVIGVRGPSSLVVLPVLADLVSAERASLPGPPTIRQ